jgi:protein SCO1/2
VNRVFVAGAVALAGLSFLIPTALPAGSGWDLVQSAKIWAGLAEPDHAGAKGWGEGYVPNVEVVTQDGEKLRFFDHLIKDKVVVISFIYTSCPDVCPLTTARMAQIQQRLGDAVGRDIFMYSISIDPENDTPEVLKEYANAFDAGPGWQFLTGTPENIDIIRDRLGDRLEDLNDHTQEVRLGNGATGEWHRGALLGDIEILLSSIRQMDKEYRDQKRTIAYNPASDTGVKFTDNPGRQTFIRFCSSCHTVGVGDRVGPDLAGVSERRDHHWLMDYIMDPVAMREKGDATAVALATKYPGVDMPRMGVGNIDARELIAYIEEETARLAAMEAEHQAGHDHSSHKHAGDDPAGDDHSDHDHGSHAGQADDHAGAGQGDHDHSSHDHGPAL